LHQRLGSQQDRGDSEIQRIYAKLATSFAGEFNITRDESIDVTELFYREQATRTEAERLRTQLDKLDAEIRRMQQHIEREPDRIAAAVEAAKTPVQNYIEQSGKRSHRRQMVDARQQVGPACRAGPESP